MDYDTVKQMLRENILNVTFNKVNGELRVMKCTLKSDFIPQEFSPKSLKMENREAVAVWDLEKSAWRSFRIDSLVKAEIT